jgi:hypothetical protein
MKATLQFNLPEEQGDFDAARLGRRALLALWEIDQRCRGLLKHGEPTEAEARLAEEVRAMIDAELLDA